MKIDSVRSLILRTRAAFSAVLLGLPMVGATPPATAPMLVAPSTAQLQKVLDERVKADPGTGVVVGILDHGKTTILKAGSSGTSRPLDEHSLFEIGSVTKTFTATILADMVLHHEVSLSDPVEQYLPSGTHVPTRDGKNITLLLLATHHSGLPRMPANFRSNDRNNPEADYTWDKLAAFLDSYVLSRDPGEAFEYSNLGGALLGDALADTVHTSYADLLQDRLLKPLGMNETSSLPASALAPSIRERITVGHNMDDVAGPPLNFNDAFAAAGAIRSSVSDMLRYVRCNLGRGPLADDCLFAQQPRDTLPGNHIGLIWWTGDYVPLIYHGGDTSGFHAAVAISPDHQRGVVVLTNGGFSAEPLAQFAIDAALVVPQPPPTVVLSPSTLAAYAGTYHRNGVANRVVGTSDGLTTQVEGTPLAFRLHALGNDRFLRRMEPATDVFTRDATGAVNALVVYRADRRVVTWVRDGMTAPAQPAATPAPVATTLDPGILAQYVGTYPLQAGTAITVTAGGASGLTTEITGQLPIPLYASAKDHFFLTVVNAQIDFTRDARGNVSDLVLHQNGVVITAHRS